MRAAEKINYFRILTLFTIDIGKNPKDVPVHDVMTVGGSTIRDAWGPFHSETSKKDVYRSKDNMNAVSTGEKREDATNYVKYEK